MIEQPVGWSIKQAFADPRGGFLLVMPIGTRGVLWDAASGYAGWGWTQNNVTEEEKFTRAALEWLTGLETGIDVLLMTTSTTTFGEWGFRNFVTRSDAPSLSFDDGVTTRGPWTTTVGFGGTITYHTPTNATWTATDWSGINPQNYDLAILPVAPTAVYHDAGIDAYLQDGGSIWAGVGSDAWSRYGINDASGNQSGIGVPDYLVAAFSCSQLGPDQYRYNGYTTSYLEKGTNTMGGTSTTYPNNSGSSEQIGLWTRV